VLLDLYIPRVDGFAVLRAVKERFQTTRVVVLTGDGSALTRQLCEVLCADAFISKDDVATEVLPTLSRMATPGDESLSS
jgi:DNA-binding NarL/FixJ family response regulator